MCEEKFQGESPERGPPSLDYDQDAVPYGDSSFSGLLAFKVIHQELLANIRKIGEEISRITKTPGVLYLNVPTVEKGRRLAEAEKSEEVEETTFLPSKGDEKGVYYYYFTKEELSSFFPGFETKNIDVRDEHYCLTGVKKELV